MKEIVIRRLTLLNFKGIRNLTIDFDEHETNVLGANGTGKTTIFDAFRWVLFGKDASDRKDFNIKTLGKDGKVIERLPHEVTACIEVGGEEITLKKCYVEKWTKKRGTAVETFTGNGIECYWNEVPCTVSEYDRKVRGICDEQVFKLITNPLFFTAQRKDFQRNMLISLVGDVSNQELADENPDFAELVGQLTGKTIDELKREVASKKRKIKDGIDTIPARIDERKRDMPELQDWAALETDIAKHEQRIAAFEAQIADRSKAYNEITKQKQEAARRLSDVRGAISAREYELKGNLLADYRKALRAHENAVNEAAGLRKERQLKQLARPRLEQELKGLQQKRQQLIEEWRGIKSETFTEPNREQFVCPTCHRPLEADDVDAKIEDLRKSFNADIAARLAKNKQLGLETKQRIEATQGEINAIDNEDFRLQEKIAVIENSEDYKIEPQQPDTAPALAADEQLKGLRKQAAELEAELSKEAAAPDTADLQQAKRNEQQAIDTDREQLRGREIIAANEKRIAELEQEYRAAQDELSQLEGTEFTIQQFCKARIERLEGKINAMFKLVRFKMYDTQINGGEIETCEATVNGVPYSDLNNAMKINAGLDIINAISNANGIVAPIFIDNRESVSEIIDVQAQVVNLIVDENYKALKIE